MGLFVVEKSLFPPHAAAIAGHLAAFANHPVARDDHGNTIGSVGLRHRAHCGRTPDGLSQVSVGRRVAVGDRLELIPDDFLKGGAGCGKRDCESLECSGKVGV